MPPTPAILLSFPPPSDKEVQDRIQQYIDGIPEQPAPDTVPTLGSPFTTPPTSTLGSPYATPPPSLVGNEEQYTPSPVLVDLYELLVSINMSSTASIAGSSVASRQENKVDIADARDGMVTSDAPDKDAGKVVEDSNSDTGTVIADTPPSQATAGPSQNTENVRVDADHSTQEDKAADVKSSASSSKEGSHVSGMHLSKYAPKPALGDWPAQVPRGPRDTKSDNAPRASREPQNTGYQGVGHVPLREKVRALEVELREARQLIEAERKTSGIAVEKAEARTIKHCDIALQQLLSENLIDKIRLVKQTEKLRVKELDLAAQTKNILKSIGDSQGQSAADSVDANEEIIRGRVVQEIARRDGIFEARLVAKEQELEIREKGIEYREKVAPAIVAEALKKIKADIRAQLEEEMAIRMANKTEQQRHGYGQGFAECLETMILMKEFQSGKISHNDPKIAFMFDPTHPKNPVARAMKINRCGTSNATSSSAFATPTNANRSNVTQMGRQHGSNGAGYRPRQHYRETYHENPNFGVPHFGTRTAESLVPDLAGQSSVLPAAERTPTTIKDNAANDSIPEDHEPAHVAVPGFSATPTPRRTAPDERVHQEDKSVDLIDLY